MNILSPMLLGIGWAIAIPLLLMAAGFFLLVLASPFVAVFAWWEARR